MAFRRVQWPLARHLSPNVNFNADPGKLVDAFLAWDRCSGPLWEEFNARAKEIDEDPALTDHGKALARAREVAAFRSRDDLQRHINAVKVARDWMTELRTKGAIRAVPTDLSPYEQVSMAHAHDRAVRRYESLQPDQQRAVLRAAMDTKNRDFLEPIYREAGLLNERDAARVEMILLEGSDPKAFATLQELAGKFGSDGQPDVTTSAVAVADFAVGQLLQAMDEWASLDRVSEDARAKFSAQLQVQGAPLTMTSEEAHDPRIYRAAKVLAQENGRILSIVGDEGQGTVDPGANGAGES